MKIHYITLDYAQHQHVPVLQTSCEKMKENKYDRTDILSANHGWKKNAVNAFKVFSVNSWASGRTSDGPSSCWPEAFFFTKV